MIDQRYLHEKAIFEELTHLKKVQIQYGKANERILVRSLIGNFCKMHELNPAHFKFQTFYTWEKFLYGKHYCKCKIINDNCQKKIENKQRGDNLFL